MRVLSTRDLYFVYNLKHPIGKMYGSRFVGSIAEAKEILHAEVRFWDAYAYTWYVEDKNFDVIARGDSQEDGIV